MSCSKASPIVYTSLYVTFHEDSFQCEGGGLQNSVLRSAALLCKV